MLRHGVTTIEAKSGYGLDLRTELRLLEVAHQLGLEGPVDVLPTWLGAHAVPPEFRDRRDPAEAYVRHLLDEQLPGVVAQGRARFADAFCEQGVFSADQSRRVLDGGRGVWHAAAAACRRARAIRRRGAGCRARRPVGRPPRGAVDRGIDALAEVAESDRPVVAVLLPATTWFLMKPTGAPARTFIERGVPVALGTDFNPGTSPTASLPLVMTVACLSIGMTPAEALAAVTVNAAHALGIGDVVGSIEPGQAGRPRRLAEFRASTRSRTGRRRPRRTVIKRGRPILQRE